jgi:hypothetical protein
VESLNTVRALIGVDRRATAAAHHMIEALRCAARIAIALHPVLEQMFVTGEQQAHLVLAEERHVARPHRGRGSLHNRAAMRP